MKRMLRSVADRVFVRLQVPMPRPISFDDGEEKGDGMDVDLSDFKPLDPGRINTHDPVELKYWCAQLHCSEATLKQAVTDVGDHVTAVRDQLSAKH